MTEGTNVFPGNLSRAPEPATGHLDAVSFFAGLVRKPGTGAPIPQGSALTVEGWALETGGDRGAAEVVVTVGSDVAVRAHVRSIARPDVVGVFRHAGVYDAGFAATVPTGALEPGSYDVNFHVIDRVRGVYSSWHARTTIEICARGDAQPLRVPGRMRIVVESVTTEPAGGGDDGLRIPENSLVLVEGSVVDTVADAAAGEVGILVNDVAVHRALYGYESNAPAASSGARAARAFGFKARFSTRTLPAGTHAFRILAVSADGSVYDAGEEHRFEVLPGPGIAGLRGTLTTQQTPAQFERFFHAGPDGIAPLLGDLRVERGVDLYLSGWAIDEPNARSGFAAMLLVDDALLFDASYGSPRADVAARFGNARYLACGFVGAIATGELEPGAHTVRCLVRSSTDATWRAGSDRVLFEVI